MGFQAGAGNGNRQSGMSAQGVRDTVTRKAKDAKQRVQTYKAKRAAGGSIGRSGAAQNRGDTVHVQMGA